MLSAMREYRVLGADERAALDAAIAAQGGCVMAVANNLRALLAEAQMLLDSANTRLDELADAGVARSYEWWVGRRDTLAEMIALLTRTDAAIDGMVLVPREPTEAMLVAGFESEPDELFSPLEVWEAYKAMTGCEQAEHRARLCYAAMLAASQPADAGEGRPDTSPPTDSRGAE